LRVADIWACYKQWGDKGVFFLTKPLDNHGWEWHCYMRDPDGYLIEVGQYTQMTLDRFKTDACCDTSAQLRACRSGYANRPAPALRFPVPDADSCQRPQGGGKLEPEERAKEEECRCEEESMDERSSPASCRRARARES